MPSLFRLLLAVVFGTFGPTLAVASSLTASKAQAHRDALWPSYVERFVEDNGRVVDTANGEISHSEGQGYAMLLAVAANDQPTFDLVWQWTRRHLGVRADGLFAWSYDPHTSSISDPNNATDGDLLIAWALARAADRWQVPAYQHAARRLTQSVIEHTVVQHPVHGLMILPGVDGFSAEERPNGPVFNLSYWVFPALNDLVPVMGTAAVEAVTQSGLSLLEVARFGQYNLPPDWLSLSAQGVDFASGFDPVFGYNAVRIPLYLIWGDVGTRGHLAPFMASWVGESLPVNLVHLVSGNQNPMEGAGYHSIAALTACAMNGYAAGAVLTAPLDTDYYPATLHLLALQAFEERALTC